MRGISILWKIGVVVFLFGAAETQSQEPEGPIEVEQIQRYEDVENLQSITSTELSPDEKFLYAASFNSDTATVWKRDRKTGKVARIQSLTDPETDGMLALRMSPDGNFMAGASIKDMVTLFTRDKRSGELAVLDAIRESENGAGPFKFPIEVRFSNDSRFVYAACSGSLEVFRIEDYELMGVQSETAGGLTSSLRDVDVSPDGNFLYTTGNNTLLIFSRNPETGKVTHHSELNVKSTPGLHGVNSVCCSPDNKHIYICSGRFVDQSAVIALERKADGSHEVIQTFLNPFHPGMETADATVLELRESDFSGGNEIEASPDGKEVWALGTESDTVARFRRDPESGRLEFQEAHLVEGDNPAIGPSGLCFSKDGRFCYVADEKEAALVVFERKLSGKE